MKKLFFIVLILAIIGATFFILKGKGPGVEKSAQQEIKEILGSPEQFALAYIPQETESGFVLARTEVWFYPEQGKKMSFLGGNVVFVEEYISENYPLSGNSLLPEDFHFDMTKEDLKNILGEENIDPIDYLPGLFEEGVFETYLSNRAIFIFEGGKLTYFQTLGLGGEKQISKNEREEEIYYSFDNLFLIPEANAKIRIKNAFRCLGKVCSFIVELPDKVTRPLGPVVGPIISGILTKNIAKHQRLGSLFGKTQKIDSVIKDIEEQKKLAQEVQKFYKEAAEEMTKNANEIRESRQELLGQLTQEGHTYEEYKQHVIALEELASSFEKGAAKFSREAEKITFENIVKMIGKDLVNKVFGQAKEIVMNNVGRELIKLINPDILESLISQNEKGADAILDILLAGDLEKIIKNKDSSKIDLEELRQRIREEIKSMLRENKEDLKRNWKNKIAEIINKKLEGLNEEVEKQNKFLKNQEEDKGNMCDGEVKKTSEQCPPGYHFERMSGVGCVQTNCKEGKIPSAHLSYTGQCICGSAGSIAENPSDPNKACRLPASCAPCPGCVYACVKTNEECPPIPALK